jgi:aspartyl-tRNA(Asn)/glutamyl-tRNA(Gln) amidotransferase subunit C
MELSREQVNHIAELARIRLSEEEAESFRRQLSSILEYVGQLAECQTDGVEPMTHAAPLLNVTREDEVKECDEVTRQRLLDAFPEREGDLLKVKAIFKH